MWFCFYYIHTKAFIILPAKMINFEMTKKVYLGKTLIKAHRKLSKSPILLFFAKYYLYTIKLAPSKLSLAMISWRYDSERPLSSIS